MKKTLLTLLLILSCLLPLSGMAQNSQRYVRKKIQPNFFIPGGALAESKPEKVYIPRYRAGQTTAKHISADDNLEPRQPVVAEDVLVSKEPEATAVTAQPVETPTYTPPSTPAPSQVDDGTPNYQKMYQDYLRDLDAIAKTGDVSDPTILNDLEAMNSEKRIEIDKKFNQSRNIQKEIQSAIKK